MTVEAKMTLTRACKDTLPQEPLWVGTKFKLETSPQDALQNEVVQRIFSPSS